MGTAAFIWFIIAVVSIVGFFIAANSLNGAVALVLGAFGMFALLTALLAGCFALIEDDDDCPYEYAVEYC